MSSPMTERITPLYLPLSILELRKDKGITRDSNDVSTSEYSDELNLVGSCNPDSANSQDLPAILSR